MKLKFILFVFVIVVAQFAFAAKDDYYGNIKLRSIGVGNMPQNERMHQATLQDNANSSYMHYYGKRIDDQNHNAPMTNNYSALRVNGGATNSNANQPFSGGEVVQTGNAMYAFMENNPSHPGPIGDAVPFMVLLALGYVFVRSKK